MSSAGVVAHAPSEDFLAADDGIVKDFPITQDFTFEGGVKGFCQGVIGTCAHCAHGLAYTKLGAVIPKGLCGVHTDVIGMENCSFKASADVSGLG